MSQKNKEALFVLAVFLWLVGSFLAGMFFQEFAPGGFRDWAFLIFVLIWAGFIGYFYYRITHSS